jgi:NAD(P)-dependent dehydrogenase (short-subunit alcohol dehydrogenase family)
MVFPTSPEPAAASLSTPQDYTPHPVLDKVRQSPPVDLSIPYELSWVKDKHILITGGASGFGAEWARVWAGAGATLVLADVNVKLGTEVAARIRQDTGNEGVHFVECDVRDWQAQVRLFKEAVRLSPHGGIDCVIANAGIAGLEPFHNPNNDFNVDEPRKPNLKVIDVNLTGVLYTTQLALWWLKRNPGSSAASVDAKPTSPRDRHLLLVSSIAGLGPILTQPLYGTSKHAVLGLFRCLRGSAFLEGVRTNIIFPYFIETPINPAAGRALVAGGNMGSMSDVVDAASRLVADSSILGRGLCIAPRAKAKQREDGEWDILPFDGEGEEKGVWEVYAHDFDDTEMFTRRLVVILNQIAGLKGWYDFGVDIFRAFRYKVLGW